MSGEEERKPDVSSKENDTPRKDGKRRQRRHFVTAAEAVQRKDNPRWWQ